MPTFFDPGEFNTKSTMPDFSQFSNANAVKVPGLSRLIGGDALVSTWPARPRSAKFVTKHLERGALIVEIKRMADLPGSLLSRKNHLEKQALRMAATGAQAHQRMLLYTGWHAPTPTGLLRIGSFDGRAIVWKHTKHNYEHFRRARSKLMDSGLLRWEGLTSNQELPIWFADKLRHLKEYKRKPVKVLRKVQLPFSRETFRQMTESEGAEAILALFDGIGLNGATRVMNYISDDFAKMAYAVEFLTNPESASLCKGIGQKTIDGFRAQFGFVNGWDKFRMLVARVTTRDCNKHGILYYTEQCPLCLLDGKDAELVQTLQNSSFITVYDRNDHRMYYKPDEIDGLVEQLKRAKNHFETKEK